MSKAFTKEEGGAQLDDLPPVEEWPAGVTNYVTPAGHAALKAELERLRAALAKVTPDNARQRVALGDRLQALVRRLEAAEVIDPTAQPRDAVRFGATVTVEDEAGRERRYRIVGVDEAEPRRGWVSWRTPVAAALSGRCVGDVTTLRTPAGDEELSIVAIEYEASHDG